MEKRDGVGVWRLRQAEVSTPTLDSGPNVDKHRPWTRIIEEVIVHCPSLILSPPCLRARRHGLQDRGASEDMPEKWDDVSMRGES